MNKITVRKWLAQNGYDDILKIINEIMDEWKRDGKKTRRNWWDILAGDKNGKSRVINGRKIPVLKAAQIRAGLPITKNALCRNENESTEEKWITNRWREK